jgi:uncharacterized protein YndB with AHSA1/START domain
MTDSKAAPHEVRIERTFDAPRALIWQMWTNPRHFERWYGPSGATVVVARMDLRVGGARHICMEMQTPNGAMQMWFVGEHLDIEPDRRLVYTESMSDEHGNVVPPSAMGMPSDHPETTRVTIELQQTGVATQMVMTHAGIPADSPGAAGWMMAFDKLTTYVDSLVSPTA